MNKLTLKFDIISYNDLINYLKQLDGIKSANINNENDEIYLEYDQSVIPLNILKKHILLYLNVLELPSIISFDKHIDNTKKDIIVINNLCCEYCLKGMIEELLDTNGIISAYSDFDYHNKKKVNIFITYSPKLINETKIDELKEKFNNNN